MPSQTGLTPEPEWIPDDAETELEMSDEDDFEFDEEAADEEVAVDADIELRPAGDSNVPVWRLIEMSREDRFLKRELADFEDYDSFDNYADDYAGVTH